MLETMYMFIIYKPNHFLASEPFVIEYKVLSSLELKESKRPKCVSLCLLCAIWGFQHSDCEKFTLLSRDVTQADRYTNTSEES